MATSPSHRFGQIVGDLLEEIIGPELEDFCIARGLYLDRKGERRPARSGRKVTWKDRYGNEHDLDFVIEKGGTIGERGRPLAFIETAWRRYTKHSRNKAQEIQGAILPIADEHVWDKPFLGAVLAGVFTEGSLAQMRSAGFEVVLFPYKTVVTSFAAVGIDVAFDESTADAKFKKTVRAIQGLKAKQRLALKKALVASNRALLTQFLDNLRAVLDRRIERIIVIPLHGEQREFDRPEDAVSFIHAYNEVRQQGGMFREYEMIVRYANGDKIEAIFADKQKSLTFLKYVCGL